MAILQGITPREIIMVIPVTMCHASHTSPIMVRVRWGLVRVMARVMIRTIAVVLVCVTQL